MSQVYKSPMLGVWAGALTKMNTMRNDSGLLCDIILMTRRSKKKYPAHRVVLASTTDYFNAMFVLNTLSHNNSPIHIIEGIDDTGLALILDFTYGQVISLNAKNVKAFLKAAKLIGIETALQIGQKIYEQLLLTGEILEDADFLSAIHQFSSLSDPASQLPPELTPQMTTSSNSRKKSKKKGKEKKRKKKVIPVEVDPIETDPLGSLDIKNETDDSEGIDSQAEIDVDTINDDVLDDGLSKLDTHNTSDLDSLIKAEPSMDEYLSALTTNQVTGETSTGVEVGEASSNDFKMEDQEAREAVANDEIPTWTHDEETSQISALGTTSDLQDSALGTTSDLQDSVPILGETPVQQNPVLSSDETTNLQDPMPILDAASGLLDSILDAPAEVQTSALVMNTLPQIQPSVQIPISIPNIASSQVVQQNDPWMKAFGLQMGSLVPGTRNIININNLVTLGGKKLRPLAMRQPGVILQPMLPSTFPNLVRPFAMVNKAIAMKRPANETLLGGEAFKKMNQVGTSFAVAPAPMSSFVRCLRPAVMLPMSNMNQTLAPPVRLTGNVNPVNLNSASAFDLAMPSNVMSSTPNLLGILNNGGSPCLAAGGTYRIEPVAVKDEEKPKRGQKKRHKKKPKDPYYFPNTTPYAYLEHNLTKPVLDLRFICKVCSMGFKYYCQRKAHMLSEHGLSASRQKKILIQKYFYHKIKRLRESQFCADVPKDQKKMIVNKSQRHACFMCLRSYGTRLLFSQHYKMKHNWCYSMAQKQLKRFCLRRYKDVGKALVAVGNNIEIQVPERAVTPPSLSGKSVAQRVANSTATTSSTSASDATMSIGNLDENYNHGNSTINKQLENVNHSKPGILLNTDNSKSDSLSSTVVTRSASTSKTNTSTGLSSSSPMLPLATVPSVKKDNNHVDMSSQKTSPPCIYQDKTICDTCFKVMPVKLLYLHQAVEHEVGKTFTAKKMCPMYACDKEFSAKIAFVDHNCQQHNVDCYVCTIDGCNSNFRQDYLLQRHLYNSHSVSATDIKDALLQSIKILQDIKRDPDDDFQATPTTMLDHSYGNPNSNNTERTPTPPMDPRVPISFNQMNRTPTPPPINPIEKIQGNFNFTERTPTPPMDGVPISFNHINKTPTPPPINPIEKVQDSAPSPVKSVPAKPPVTKFKFSPNAARRIMISCIKRHKCWICYKQMDDSLDLVSHLKSEHQMGDILKMSFYCKYPGCMYTCDHRMTLHQHYKKRHTGKLDYSCSECRRIFSDETSLKRHFTASHSESQACQKCDKIFQSAYTLSKHLKFCGLTKKLIKCSACNYESNDAQAMMNHEFCRHSILPSKQQKVYICTVCGYQTLRKTILDNHMLVHSESKKYGCEICHRRFRLPGQLQTHMNIHSNKNNYACEFCLYRTNAMRRLRQHLRVMHTDKDLKPFACPYCEFSTRLRSNCLKHVKRGHSDQPIKVIKTVNIKE